MLTDTRSPYPASPGAEEDLRRHAAEHAALRRVATLIAHEVHPQEVFAAVAEEVALTLGVPLSAVIRFDAEGIATQVGAWGEENPFPVGTSWSFDEGSVSGQVARTGRAARVDDYAAIPGDIASRLAREAGIHTAVGVPILVEGSLWGAMMALSTMERPLVEGVEARLGAFTELIATAIANTQARDDLRRLVEEQAALQRVATLVAKGATPYEVFAAVAEEVARVLDVPAISMVRFEPDETSTAIAVWGDGNPFGVGATFEPWPGVMHEVRQTGRAARLEDFAYSTGPTTKRLLNARIHSGLGVPITVEGRVWGTIIALATGGDSLPAGIADRLSSFTDLVATAIANTEARDDLRKLAEEQAALRRVALLVAQEAEQPELFAVVAREASRVLGNAMIEIVRCDPDRRATGVGAWGEHPFVAGSQWTLDGPSVIASVLDTGRPARIDDYAELPGSLAAAAREAGFRSAVGAPIVVDGRTWGVINVISRDPQPLPAETEDRLASFSELVAMAVSKTEARDALRTSEELYRRAIAEAGAVPYVLDYATGTYSFIGEGIEDLTGYRPEELDHEVFGRLVLETFLHGEQARLDETDAAYRTRAGEFGRWRTDLRIRRRDGEIRWLSDASVEMLGEHGPSVGSIGMLQDITERMRTDEERLRLAAILEATTDVVTLMDRNGRVLYVNRAGHRLLGLRAEEDVSSLTLSGMQAAGAEAGVVRDGLPTAISQGVWSGEGALLSRDGREVPVSQVVLAHKDARGDVTFVSAIARDLSERLELESSLRSTQDEQAALRRVATLVAQEAEPTAVFDAVAAEVARLFDVEMTSVLRYEPDGASVKVGGSGHNNPFSVGARLAPSAGVIPVVWQTGRSARVDDYRRFEDPVAQQLSQVGIRSSVGVPIIVDGVGWGTMVVLSADPARLPPGTEERLSRFTELVATAIANAQARDDLRRLVDEQAALRRVATLVAEGAGSPVVYDAICRETGPVIGATSVNLCHFTTDRFNLTMAGWSVHDTHVPTGTRLPIEGGTINELVHESGEAARIESYSDAEGALADLIRERGIKSEVAAPVIVDGRLWGAIIAGWDTEGPPPPRAERRLAGFAEIVATSVSNALTRSELVASRARIVTAADAARRNIERNLHDGIQQQLVALELELKTVEAGIPAELEPTRHDLERLQGVLENVLDDVREISQGVHPATLSQWGLGPALRTLTRRSPIPIELEINVLDRLPDSVEIATYYVVSESLANVTKHAQASYARVEVKLAEDWLYVSIRDDGIGGADAAHGSGLTGLVDRVEALGGRFSLASAPKQGTAVSASLPLGS